MPKRGSLRKALLWSFAITSITPIVLIGLVSLAHLTKSMRTSVRVNQSILAHSIAHEISADLGKPLAVLRMIQAAIGQDHDDSVINELLDQAVARTGFFDSIYILDADDKIEHVGLSPGLLQTREDFIGMDFSGLPVHQHSTGPQDHFWSDSFLSVLTGKLSLTLSLPIHERILTGNFNIEMFGESVCRGKQDLTTSSIIDHDGNVIFSCEDEVAGQKRNLQNLPIVSDGLKGNTGTYSYEVNGVDAVGSSASIPETNWLVVVSQDKDAAYAAVARIRNFFLLGIFGAAALAGVIAYALSSKLSHQLMSLTNTTRSISKGRYDAQLPTQHYREMEELASSFRTMAQAVHSREEILRESEQALQKSREEYMALVEGSPDIIMRFDHQGRFLFASESIESVTGIPAETFIGKTHRELGFPEDKCILWDEQIQRVFTSGEPGEIEFEFDSPKGTITFNWRLLPEKDDNGNVTSLYSNVRDVTEFRKVQRDYQSLFNSMLSGFAVHEIITDETGKPIDYRFLAVNPSFEKFTGLKASDIIGKTVRQVLPNTEASWIETYGKVALTGEPIQFENYAQELGKHYTVVAFSPQKNQFACIFHDMTERMLAEEALRESEERLRGTFEQAAVGIANFEMGGKFIRINQRLCEISGFSRKELLNKLARDIIHPKDLEVYPELWPKLVVGEIPHYSIEMRLVRKDGTSVWTNVTVSLVRDPDDKPLYAIGVFEDLSARKAIEQENLLLEDQLRQAMKMEAVGRLAGGVAHDFNNLLTPILGYTEMVLTKEHVSGKGKAALEQVFRAADKAKSLTQQLLAFGRKQTFQPQLLNLNEAIDSSSSMLRRLITEDVDIKLDLDDSLGDILADPTQIEQVLMNLAINASDAMPNGGSITIRTANASMPNNRPIPPRLCEDDFVRLEFIDTGCGMDDQTQERIFEPFFTTKAVTKGTGLGLATVYGVIKQHGGRIQVESEVGSGTTFCIHLPIAKDQPQPALATNKIPTQTRATNGSETVLIVEDDPDVRVLARDVLKDYGYNVVEASGADEAIEYAFDRKGRIDLLLTDVIMPKMNGRQLCEKLSTKYPTLKTLYMSGYPGDTIGHHGVLEEGIPFIEKPFSIAGLAMKVRQVLDN